MAVAWVAAAVRTLRRSGQAWHKRRGRQPVSVFTDKFPNGSSCTSANSGRVFEALDKRYEVSLCDLLDSGVDFVYDHKGQRMHWREDTTSRWETFP